jgi:hypothetical protein
LKVYFRGEDNGLGKKMTARKISLFISQNNMVMSHRIAILQRNVARACDDVKMSFFFSRNMNSCF